MKRKGEGAGLSFLLPFFTVLASGLFGFYICLALQWTPPGRSPYLAVAVVAAVGLLGFVYWLKTYIRGGRENPLSASLPYISFLIPVFFFPDYFVGHGPPLFISIAVMVITLLCFIALRFLIFSPSSSRLEERISNSSLKIAVTASLIFIVAAAGCGAVRYFNFGFPGLDLGCFIQSFWTTLHGKLFWNTWELYPGGSRFGKQFSPVMFLILLFFSLFPHCMTIVILDAVVLGLGGLAVYFLARHSLGKYAGVCFALCYLMYPGIAYGAWSPYYFMHYAPLFLLLSLYYFKKQKFLPFCIFLILACSVREDITLTTFMFGVYALLTRMKARWVLFPIVVSVLWFAVATQFIIPSLGSGTVWEFYGDLGGSFGGIVWNMVRNPGALLPKFFTYGYMKFVYLVFMPLGLVLPLMGSELIFALPTLAVIGLSSMDRTRYVYGYYYMPLIPFIFASSMTAVKRLSSGRLLASLEGRPAVGVCCTFLLFLSLAVFVRGPLYETFDSGVLRSYNARFQESYNQTLRKVIEQVPAEASLFAPKYMMPHLAKRTFLVPNVPGDTEYLIIDSRTGDPGTVKIQEDKFIVTLDENPAYVKLFDENGVRLYRRTQD